MLLLGLSQLLQLQESGAQTGRAGFSVDVKDPATLLHPRRDQMENAQDPQEPTNEERWLIFGVLTFVVFGTLLTVFRRWFVGF